MKKDQSNTVAKKKILCSECFNFKRVWVKWWEKEKIDLYDSDVLRNKLKKVEIAQIWFCTRGLLKSSIYTDKNVVKRLGKIDCEERSV